MHYFPGLRVILQNVDFIKDNQHIELDGNVSVIGTVIKGRGDSATEEVYLSALVRGKTMYIHVGQVEPRRDLAQITTTVCYGGGAARDTAKCIFESALYMCTAHDIPFKHLEPLLRRHPK